MQHINALQVFLALFFIFSVSITPAFSLTESVNLFGEINSADLVLNDIWIEPENPRNGETVTVHGSLYNAGIIPINDVSDAVTVAYIINGELSEIKLLDNIQPGTKNGRVISSGPIFDATSGDHTVTVIVNYHDTLSHLRDNPKNNIVQKIFKIEQETPSAISYEVYQAYDEKTKTQKITIEGTISDIFQQSVKEQEIIINIENITHKKIKTNTEGQFFFTTEIEFAEKPIEITISSDKKSIIPVIPQSILPIQINEGQSALSLKIVSESLENSFKNSPLTIVLFQDSYDNLFKKISTDEINKESLRIDDRFLTTLPSEHDYIIEIYMEGRLLDAFQESLPNSKIIEKEISITESAQIQFRAINSVGEPQSNVIIKNWTYSTETNEGGNTDWTRILPTFTENEPYVAQAIFPDGEIVWSEPFLIESNERKTISIIKGSSNQ